MSESIQPHSTNPPRPNAVNVGITSSIYAPLSPSPGGLSSRMIGGGLNPSKPAIGHFGLGIARTTSDNSAEQQKVATADATNGVLKREYRPSGGVGVPRRGGGASSGGSSRNPQRANPASSSSSSANTFERTNNTTNDRDFRFREAAAATSDAANAENDGWSKVGGGRRDKRADEPAAAPPARTNDRFMRYRGEAGKDGENRTDENRSGPSGAPDRRGDFRRSDKDGAREGGARTWDREDRTHRPSDRRSNFPRRGTSDHFSEGGAESSKWHSGVAADEDEATEEGWDQPTPGCFSKAELLALWNPALCAKPTTLVDLEGLQVVSLETLQPVNIAPPSEEESQARAAGNWFGKSYPLKHRGPVVGGRGAPVPSASTGRQFGRDEHHGDEHDDASRDSHAGGRKVIRTLAALPAKQWNDDADSDAHASSHPNMSGPTSPARRGIATLGALPNANAAPATQTNSANWRQEEAPYQQQQQQQQQQAQQQQQQQQVEPQQFEYNQQPQYVDPHQQQQQQPQPTGRPTAWYYKDPQGDTQGPFTDEEMRDWYEKGYFDLKLLVQCDIDFSRPDAQHVAFAPLGVWFFQGKKAFLERIPDMSAQKTIQGGHMQPQQHHQQQQHFQPQQPDYPNMQRLHMGDEEHMHMQPQHPSAGWGQPQPQPGRVGAAPVAFGGNTWQPAFAGAGPGQPAMVQPQAAGWPNQVGYHALGQPQPQPIDPRRDIAQRMQPPVGVDPAQYLLNQAQMLIQQQQQQQQQGQRQAPAQQPPADAQEQQRHIQQRMAMLQAQQQAAIAQAREQQLRESREALLRDQQSPVASSVAPPAATLAPWSKVPATSPPAQSMFHIQQQAELEEEAARARAEEEAERVREEEAEAARTKQAWAAAAAQNAAAQKAAQKEQAVLAKAQATAEAEAAREEAAARALAAKEAKKAAAAAAAAQPSPAKVTPPAQKPSSFQLIQEEEERQAAAAAASQNDVVSWAPTAGQPNPAVSWSTTSPAAPAQPKKKVTPVKAEPPQPAVHLTREQKLAAAKEKKERDARERREAELQAERDRKEDEERKKKEQLERAKTLQKATWGVTPTTGATDLRAIQAADAARAAAEEQKRQEQAALAGPVGQPLMAKWGGANKPALSFREIQELEEAQRMESVTSAAAIVSGNYTSGAATWGAVASPSPKPSPPIRSTSGDASGQDDVAVDDEDDIWGKPVTAVAPSGPTVASKLAATFAQQKSQAPTKATRAPSASPTSSAASAPASSPSAATATAPTTPAKKQPSENTFGGPQMSLDFENWCRAQLEKISGSSDVTLGHFLLTLESRSQIEEYIKEYLGDTPDTTKFAAGFIKFRDAAIARTAHQANSIMQSPLPASAAAAAAAADAKRKKALKKK